MLFCRDFHSILCSACLLRFPCSMCHYIMIVYYHGWLISFVFCLIDWLGVWRWQQLYTRLQCRAYQKAFIPATFQPVSTVDISMSHWLQWNLALPTFSWSFTANMPASDPIICDDLHHHPTLTHTRLTALFPGLPRWASTRKVKPIWILLKQETVSGSGISWATCKSAPRCRQTTTPAPHHSVFTGRVHFLLPNQQRQSTSTEGTDMYKWICELWHPALNRLKMSPSVNSKIVCFIAVEMNVKILCWSNLVIIMTFKTTVINCSL